MSNIDNRKLNRAFATIVRVEKKMPHHTKRDKRYYRNAKRTIETFFAILVIETEVRRIKLKEHQELKEIMREP